MNRRSFLRNSALALFGFTVLPPASTYGRVWRATPTPFTEFVTLEYRANALGSLTRVPLPTSPAIDLMNFFDEATRIAKKRSIPERSITIYTDRETAALFEERYA